jgi:hypothetical protein
MLAVFLLVFGSVFYFIQHYFNWCSPANSLTYWIPFTGLFAAGYAFGNIRRINITLAGLFYFASLAVTVLGIYFYYLKTQENSFLSARGCLTFYTDSYLSFNVVAMSVAAFIIIMHSRLELILKVKKLKMLVYSIARASLGIFVLHIFFLDVLDRQLNLFIWITPAWLYLTVKVLTVFAVSYLATIILIKIPLLKRVFGEK